MSSSVCRLAGLIVVPLALCLPLSAAAQRAPDAGTAPDAGLPPPEETAGGAVSAEELAQIEAALEKEQTEATPYDPASHGSHSHASGPALSFHGLEISFILDAALAAFTAEEPLQTGGHDPRANGFTLQQLELSLASAVDPYFRFDGNVVFSQYGVEVEEAYAMTTGLPANLQVRAGQFLTRLGRLNSTHPHSWDFVDQPFSIGRLFGGEGNRGLGVELSWLTPLPWFVEVLGSATDASGEATARSFFGGEDNRVVSPFDFQFTGAVKQFFPLSDDLSLLWGLSAASGPNPTGYRNRTDVYATDLFFRYRPTTEASHTSVSLQAELFYRRRQIPGDVLTDLSGYTQLVWRFDQRWGAAGRYELGSPAHDLAGRIAEDPLDPEWTALRQRLSANVTFWPTEFSRLRLQMASDLVGWRERPDYSAFLALEVVMGAHGAHAF